MPLPGTVQSAPSGIRGFDVNVVLTPKLIRTFRDDLGYRYVLRYVRRDPVNSHDLSPVEAERILEAGLALMPVQHVKPGSWRPTPALGTQYGKTAAEEADRIGFPPGVNVWLDLEMVQPGVPRADVIAYCNNWFDQVAAAGYAPGVYVGFNPGLSPEELFKRLKFRHYWKAFNAHFELPVRGWQLRQSPQVNSPAKHDPDVTRTDALGGEVRWLALAGHLAETPQPAAKPETAVA